MRVLMRAARSAAAVASVIAGFTVVAAAQSFPSRPVTLLVPFPPGGVIDTTARVIEAELAKELGQPIVIENKGGSGGNLGTQMVARAAPDGHTILMVPNAVVVMNPYTFKNYPIDPAKDIAGVAMVGETYIGLVVQSSSPFNTVQDVVAAAKAKPGELTYAHIGPGSAHNIAGALLNKKANVNITPVPFQGAGPDASKPARRPYLDELRHHRRRYAVSRIQTDETHCPSRAGTHQEDAECDHGQRGRTGRRSDVLGRCVREGLGAAQIDGQMIDIASLRILKNTLDRAELFGM